MYQKMILDMLLDRLRQHGWKPVHDTQYGNTGWVRVVDGDLFSVRAVYYDFTPSGFYFAPAGAARSGDRIASHTYGQRRSPMQVDYVKDSPRHAVEATFRYLAGVDSATEE